jgi:hypothetical protein
MACRVFAATFVSVAVFLAGCGPSGPTLATVSGKITLDGQPLPNVNVQFVPEKGGSPSYGGTNANGEYELLHAQNRKGALLGKHLVDITAREQQIDDNGKPTGPKPVKLPQKQHPAEVKAGSNAINFDLKSE